MTPNTVYNLSLRRCFCTMGGLFYVVIVCLLAFVPSGPGLVVVETLGVGWRNGPLPSVRSDDIGGDSCVCLGQQEMNYPFSSFPSLPSPFLLPLPSPLPSPPSFPFPFLPSPRGSGAESPVYGGPRVSTSEIFWNLIRGLVHSGAVWRQIGGSAQVCTEVM